MGRIAGSGWLVVIELLLSNVAGGCEENTLGLSLPLTKISPQSCRVPPHIPPPRPPPRPPRVPSCSHTLNVYSLTKGKKKPQNPLYVVKIATTIVALTVICRARMIFQNDSDFPTLNIFFREIVPGLITGDCFLSGYLSRSQETHHAGSVRAAREPAVSPSCAVGSEESL